MSAPSSIQLKRPALSAENGDAGMLLLLVATLAPRVVRHAVCARASAVAVPCTIVSHFLQSKQEMLSVIYSSINRIQYVAISVKIATKMMPSLAALFRIDALPSFFNWNLLQIGIHRSMLSIGIRASSNEIRSNRLRNVCPLEWCVRVPLVFPRP